MCESLTIDRLAYLKKISQTNNADNRFADYQGMVIERVEFLRINVFDGEDPDEDNSLYQFLNKLHYRTRQSALSPQLKFAEGQHLDPANIAESERNLRARRYLSDAYIMPIAHCNNRVHLLVVTKDAWTTQPIVVVSREGGGNKSRAGLVEGNFFGTGAEVSVLMTQEPDRSSVAYGFKKDYLWGKPLELGFGFSDNSDGYARNLNFGKPFYFNNTKNSFSARFAQNKARLSVKQDALLLANYRVDEQNNSLFGGLRVLERNNYLGRLYAGVTQYSVDYDQFYGLDNLSPKMNSEITYPWLAVEGQSTQFIILRNINAIEAVEDLRVGNYWWASLGYSPSTHNSSADSKSAAWIFNGRLENRMVNKHRVVNLKASLKGVDYLDEPLETFYSGILSADYLRLLGERNRLYASAFYQSVNANALHDALYLGGAQGVRGYPAYYVIGDEAVGVSLEYRYHSPWYFLNIIRLGFAAYFDSAVLENGQYPLYNNGYSRDVLSNVGVGLRLTSTKTQVGNMLHLDFAVPTGYRVNAPDYQFLIRAEQHF
ncbi:MAG: BamA/TamA family outer membrane protein [Marinagarivorans sp.]|nr:BamA/TamA family outer membrane protein [Marinagarivorans sp.]